MILKLERIFILKYYMLKGIVSTVETT